MQEKTKIMLDEFVAEDNINRNLSGMNEEYNDKDQLLMQLKELKEIAIVNKEENRRKYIIRK